MDDLPEIPDEERYLFSVLLAEILCPVPADEMEAG